MEVPAGARQEFLRIVSATEGLAGLGATVARNAPAMLLEVGHTIVYHAGCTSKLVALMAVCDLASLQASQHSQHQANGQDTALDCKSCACLCLQMR